MRRELDEALCRDFPNLYMDRHSDCRVTCMCWGFPGDGWEPLIRELATKLEPMIEKFKKDNMYKLNCTCNHDFYDDHWGRGKVTGVCNHMDRMPLWRPAYARGCHVPDNKVKAFFVLKWFHMKWRVQNWIGKFFDFLADHTPLHTKKFCDCVEYEPDCPRASQVKEKFGTLRFYMTRATDEMYDLIQEAEAKSATICEDCGKPGILRSGGWIRTLCDECCIKDRGSLTPGFDDEEDDEDEEGGAVILDIRPQVEVPSGGDKESA